MSSAGEDLLVLIRKHMKLRSWTILPTDVKLVISEVKAEAAGVIGTALAFRQTLRINNNLLPIDSPVKSSGSGTDCHSVSERVPVS